METIAFNFVFNNSNNNNIINEEDEKNIYEDIFANNSFDDETMPDEDFVKTNNKKLSK